MWSLWKALPVVEKDVKSMPPPISVVEPPPSLSDLAAVTQQAADPRKQACEVAQKYRSPPSTEVSAVTGQPLQAFNRQGFNSMQREMMLQQQQLTAALSGTRILSHAEDQAITIWR